MPIHKASRPLAALIAAAALLVPAQAETPAVDAQAQALLAKHLTYVGWQFGDGTFRTMRITGNVTNGKGEQTEMFVMLSAGLAYNDTYTMTQKDNITEQDGFTGNLFWRSNINGVTTPVYGDYAKYLASYTLFTHEGTTGLPATFTGNRTVDGKSVGLVRVTLHNGDPIDLYIDPATGAYVQATIDPDGAYETTYHILSYRDVLPGKKMMSSFRIEDDKDVHTFTQFEPNVDVSNDALHPPVPTASWSFDNHDPYPITLTHDRILIDATVNGVKGRFILDTGADAIYLDDRFADQANAKSLKGNSEAYTMQGSVATRVRRVATLAVGGATLQNALVYSQDFRRQDARGLDWQGYDGLMGFDLFAAAIVKLDVYASKITILDPTADLSDLKGLPLTVDIGQGIPTIPMLLNKSIAVNAMLDTGNPGIIFFGPELAKQHHLRFLGCGTFDSLTIGPIVYAFQEACESDFAANYMLLGYDFLKHFDFVFDYPHGRMFMSPNKN